MADTRPVYARIDSKIKENAEAILSKLGITPTSAIAMFYSQVILCNGMPFLPAMPAKKPLCLQKMSKDDFDREMKKAMDDIEEGRVITLEELDKELAEEFDI